MSHEWILRSHKVNFSQVNVSRVNVAVSQSECLTNECLTNECLIDAPITAAYWVSQVNVSQVNISQENAAMGWLRLAARGSLKLQVSFAKEPYKRDYILQKRPIILRSLLDVQSCWVSHVNVSQVHVAHHSLVVRHDSFTRVSQVNVAVSQLESEYK